MQGIHEGYFDEGCDNGAYQEYFKILKRCFWVPYNLWDLGLSAVGLWVSHPPQWKKSVSRRRGVQGFRLLGL